MEHIKDNVDILVIGGGTAGTIAAIQAGRTGLRTALIESGSQLGGVTTTGGVSFPGLFHAWGKQIIAGIGWELVTKAVALDSGKLPDFSVPPERHWMHQIRHQWSSICRTRRRSLYASRCEIAFLRNTSSDFRNGQRLDSRNHRQKHAPHDTGQAVN